jgi:gamma-glutamylcyclotransferase (GGCT)/AIG2-like uncharacterized protein YtfP
VLLFVYLYASGNPHQAGSGWKDYNGKSIRPAKFTTLPARVLAVPCRKIFWSSFEERSVPVPPRKNMQNLFTYGSLMCEDIMFAVVGGALRHTRAILPEHCRLSVKNQHYPGVVPSIDGSVDGIVYHDIAPEGWSRLDRFEGEMYSRRLVTVLYENGDEAQVYCYVFRPEFQQQLTAEEWDFDIFLHSGKRIFQTRYPGFKDIE